jgi:hypothetical protein
MGRVFTWLPGIAQFALVFALASLMEHYYVCNPDFGIATSTIYLVPHLVSGFPRA